MKNIHLFETKDAFDKAKSSLILPTVSYIKENNDVKYNPTFDANGHEFVEIAGIKWATMNVGAKSITDYGLYFQWGDTQGYTADQVGRGEGKKAFSWSDYKFTTDGGNTFTKYNSSDKKKVLDLEDDAVHANWGGSWRMPTMEDMQTVLNSTAVTTEWTTIDGVNGRLCTDKKDSSKTLFLPACGCANDGAVYYAGVYGGYWLSSLDTYDVSNAYYLYFGSVNVDVYNYYYRCYGQCVRGVLAEN